MDKSAAAKEWAEGTYETNYSEKIFRLVGTKEEEASPDEPIKMLEVDPDTIPVGIEGLYFGKGRGHKADNFWLTAYSWVLIAITPDEFISLQDGSLKLPNGWKLGQSYKRP